MKRTVLHLIYVTFFVLQIGFSSDAIAEEHFPEARLDQLQSFVGSINQRVKRVAPSFSPLSYEVDGNDPEVEELYSRISLFLFGGNELVQLVSTTNTIFAQFRSYESRVFVHTGALSELKKYSGKARAKRIMLFALAHELSHWIFENYRSEVLEYFDLETKQRMIRLAEAHSDAFRRLSVAGSSGIETVWKPFTTANRAELSLEHSLIDILALSIMKVLGQEIDGLETMHDDTMAVMLVLLPDAFKHHAEQTLVDFDIPFRKSVMKSYIIRGTH